MRRTKSEIGPRRTCVHAARNSSKAFTSFCIINGYVTRKRYKWGKNECTPIPKRWSYQEMKKWMGLTND